MSASPPEPDIDGYLGLFLQSVVHLRAEMESMSAGWREATVGRDNLAASVSVL